MNSSLIYQIAEAETLCGVDQNNIRYFIAEHWVTPLDPDKNRFDEEDIERIKLIWELKDLGANDESIPIILHLIDQLNHLHRELRH